MKQYEDGTMLSAGKRLPEINLKEKVINMLFSSCWSDIDQKIKY